jgi:hypothetical protein
MGDVVGIEKDEGRRIRDETMNVGNVSVSVGRAASQRGFPSPGLNFIRR